MIDEDGYRYNVGIIVVSAEGKLLWCRRIGSSNAWQFPQGGMHPHETEQQAMYRELQEELGLLAPDVEVLAQTSDWLSYRLPKQYIRYDKKPLVIGQKQCWFLLKLCADESQIELDSAPTPEFDRWRWVSFWYPIDKVIAFKRNVYWQALKEFEPIVNNLITRK